MMLRLIATVQTNGGLIDRVVCESTDIGVIMGMDAYWSAQPRTVATRIES